MRSLSLALGSLLFTSAALSAGCAPGGPADGVQREVLSAAYDGSQYVIVGERWDMNVVGPSRPIVMTSPDARDFTVRDADLPAVPLNSVAWGNGVFLAVGGQLYQNEGQSEFKTSVTAVYSSDGATWADSAGVPDDYLQGVAFGNGVFVTVAADGRTFHSVDGQKLTAGPKVDLLHAQGITFGAGKFVIFGGGSSVFVSENGSSFSQVSLPVDIAYVDFAGGAFRGSGSVGGDVEEVGDAKRLFSHDGMSWSVSDASSRVQAVAELDGTFLGLVDTNVFRSDDGETWESAKEFDLYHYRYDVITAEGQFVIVGRNEVTLSPDGQSFESISLF